MSSTTEFRLRGSRDPLTGQVFYPRRELSADGELRVLEDAVLPTVGVLHSFAAVDGVAFGLIDLDGGVRLQCEIAAAEYEAGTHQRDTGHEIGAEYLLDGDDEGWRFIRA